MNRNSIRWHLPVSYAVIALIAALSLGSMMLLVLRGYYADQEQEYLMGNAIALQPVLQEIMQSEASASALQNRINGLSFLSQAQIRLLDTNGNTIADSGVPDANQVVAVSGGMPVVGNVMFSAPVDAPQEEGPLFIYKSDISVPYPQVVPFEKQLALGKAGDIIVPVSASPYGYGFVANVKSDPTRRSSQSVSLPLVASDGSKLGELEISNGPSYGADVIRSVTTAWLIASIFAITLAAITGWFISQRVTRPVLALENATHQMAQGDLAVRVDLPYEKQQEFISLASSFNGMAEQVEQTVSTLRDFVADAAHELHTPLTALQANIELARDADEQNASARTRYLSRAQEQGLRLEALVKSLLDLSRIEAADAKAKSDFASFDMIQLVREVGEQFASRAEQADRSFTMNVPEHPVRVSGNEMHLRQVLINLLENSLKFTPSGGMISLDLEQSADEIKLTVSDSGIGIPPEDQPHIFERFHRGRNAAEYSGNGLGLAIVKAIMTEHNGAVTASSQPGQGTLITITLPVESS